MSEFNEAWRTVNADKTSKGARSLDRAVRRTLQEFTLPRSAPSGGLLHLPESITNTGPTPYCITHPPAHRFAGIFWAGCLRILWSKLRIAEQRIPRLVFLYLLYLILLILLRLPFSGLKIFGNVYFYRVSGLFDNIKTRFVSYE